MNFRGQSARISNFSRLGSARRGPGNIRLYVNRANLWWEKRGEVLLNPVTVQFTVGNPSLSDSSRTGWKSFFNLRFIREKNSVPSSDTTLDRRARIPYLDLWKKATANIDRDSKNLIQFYKGENYTPPNDENEQLNNPSLFLYPLKRRRTIHTLLHFPLISSTF